MRRSHRDQRHLREFLDVTSVTTVFAQYSPPKAHLNSIKKANSAARFGSLLDNERLLASQNRSRGVFLCLQAAIFYFTMAEHVSTAYVQYFCTMDFRLPRSFPSETDRNDVFCCALQS